MTQTTKPACIVIGLGEMGSVFARALLRYGHPVIPANRDTDLQQLAAEQPDPELVLVAVGEADLHAVLKQVPEIWHDQLALLQNELLPRDWQQHGIKKPTVISVWFEKKRGQDSKVIIPSPAFGPKASLLVEALGSIGIAAREVDSAAALLNELIIKNAYILTANIAGLETGGTVAALWADHNDFARAICNDVLDIQQWLIGEELDRNAIIEGMVHAFEGDPEHQCTGRSAPARLKRALGLADEAGLSVPALRAIAT